MKACISVTYFLKYLPSVFPSIALEASPSHLVLPWVAPENVSSFVVASDAELPVKIYDLDARSYGLESKLGTRSYLIGKFFTNEAF